MVLEIVGAASATIPGTATNPTTLFTSHMPTAIADITLVAIALGAISANVLNIYSGVMSFLSIGVRLPLALRRAIVALGFGSIGFVVAWTGLHNGGSKYENFLLVIAYWIGPWLGVFFTDQILRRGLRVDGFLFDRKHNPWAGAAAMAIGMAVSIVLFSDQTEYVGVIPKAHPGIGDLTFEVGFVLSAVLYAIFYAVGRDRRSEAMVIPGAADVPPVESDGDRSTRGVTAPGMAHDRTARQAITGASTLRRSQARQAAVGIYPVGRVQPAALWLCPSCDSVPEAAATLLSPMRCQQGSWGRSADGPSAAGAIDSCQVRRTGQAWCGASAASAAGSGPRNMTMRCSRPALSRSAKSRPSMSSRPLGSTILQA